MKALLSLVALLWIFASATFPKAAAADPDVFMRSGGLSISEEAYNLVIKHEIGGGASYYNRYLRKPCYPGGASGITIGVGYDLRFNSKAQIAADWKMLHPDTVARLQTMSGKQGTSSLARSLASISIPYDVALEVFKRNTIPRFASMTRSAYPGVEKLHPHIQGSMLSWTFNRGGGISPSSSRDLEKRNMRAAIPAKPERLPGQFRASKRIWVGKGLDGLIGRREDEALLSELGIKLGKWL